MCTPEDLLGRRLIFSETPLVQWKQWFGKFGVAESRKSYDFAFDRSYMSLEAAALGHGIALESTMLASVHYKKGFARTGLRSHVCGGGRSPPPRFTLPRTQICRA